MKKYLRYAFDIVLMNEQAMRSVADDKDAYKPALIILGTSAVIKSLGSFFFPVRGIVVYRPGFLDVVGESITTFVILLLSFYLCGYFVQEFFKGKIGMEAFVKVMSFGTAIGFIGILPKLNIIAGIWGFLIFLAVLRRLAQIEWEAVAVLVLIIVFAGLVI